MRQKAREMDALGGDELNAPRSRLDSDDGLVSDRVNSGQVVAKRRGRL
jgi:hypothetical protein